MKIIQPTASTLEYIEKNSLSNIEPSSLKPSKIYKDVQPGDAVNSRAGLNSAYSKMGESLANEVQSNIDYKTETEQYGKQPWMRWFSHPLIGRNADKALADSLFLSFFGHSSATDSQRSRGIRAIIRVMITVIVMGLFYFVSDYITSS